LAKCSVPALERNEQLPADIKVLCIDGCIWSESECRYVSKSELPRDW
jgi:hypothetical protein